MGVHGELAHIVEERRPAQAVTVGRGEVQLVGDHVRESPDPLGVATGDAVVTAQGGGQGQDLFGHDGRHLAGPLAAASATLEVPGRARSPCHLHPFGSLVGEKHRHLEKGRQGQ
jgi:hypothetical protein